MIEISKKITFVFLTLTYQTFVFILMGQLQFSMRPTCTTLVRNDNGAKI